MDTIKEFQNLKKFDSDKEFEYRGTVYSLDLRATRDNPTNANLEGKPLKMLTGKDRDGNVVTVWSHDCVPVEKVKIKTKVKTKGPRTKTKTKVKSGGTKIKTKTKTKTPPPKGTGKDHIFEED